MNAYSKHNYRFKEESIKKIYCSFANSIERRRHGAKYRIPTHFAAPQTAMFVAAHHKLHSWERICAFSIFGRASCLNTIDNMRN